MTLIFLFTISSQRFVQAYLEVLLTFPLPLQERFLDKSFSATVWWLWIHALDNGENQGIHDLMIKCVDMLYF